MSKSENRLFNRRDLTRGAIAGATSLVLGASAVAEDSSKKGESGFHNVREFGALGNGKSDDSEALQKALDAAARESGGVFVPPGTYLTHELKLRRGTALVGIPAWNYSGGSGSVFNLADTNSTCLLNLTDARGATIEGLSLEGGNLGAGIHGIATHRSKWGEHEDGFRIERCQVTRFTGDGMHLECAWCFSVRHCQLAYNHGDGLSLRGWDGFLLDNWFSGNKKAGFAARQENASVTFTANRVEWNGEENLVIAGGDGYQITGNFFDRAGTCGIALRQGRGPCNQVTITGNFIKRSGKLADQSTHESAQILLEGAQGVTCIGNSIQAGRDDGGEGVWSPSYGIVYQGLRNCVVRDNVLHDGALRKLLLDLEGHQEGVIVSDNPGRLFTDLQRKW